jgi:hypothetical protein
VLVAAVPELSGPGPPLLLSVPDGDGEPDWLGEPEPDCGDGDPDCGDGEPDCGEGEPDCGEPDCGGGLPELPVGGGGDCGGSFRNSRMAISTARAVRSSISSQETRIVRQPARSNRPGQGSGHNLVSPGFTLSIQ